MPDSAHLPPVPLRLQNDMTDIQSRDVCGIHTHPTPRPVSHVMHSGNSQQNAEISQTEDYTRRLGTGSLVTIRKGSTISTDCPHRPVSATEQDRAAGADLGIIQFNGPVHQHYVTEHTRLKSFSFWPPALPQRPQELAEAGFFYTGRSDQVKCFYCDGGLESWEPEDSPWGEHKKWFSSCTFVKMMKDKLDDERNGSIHETRSSMKTRSFKTENTVLENQRNETTKEVDTNATPEEENREPINETKLKSLQKQVENLREERNCKICLENEASIVFLPCGHLCSCANCAPALKNCAVCRTPIQGLVKTYMV